MPIKKSKSAEPIYKVKRQIRESFQISNKDGMTIFVEMDGKHIGFSKDINEETSWTFRSHSEKETITRWRKVIALISKAIDVAEEHL